MTRQSMHIVRTGGSLKARNVSLQYTQSWTLIKINTVMEYFEIFFQWHFVSSMQRQNWEIVMATVLCFVILSYHIQQTLGNAFFENNCSEQ